MEFDNHSRIYVSKSKRLKTLKKLVSYLESKSVNWTLMCGSLLGYVRDNDFIDWDCDGDIGVPSRDWKKISVSELHEHGFETRSVDVVIFRARIKVTDPTTGFHIDLYELQERKNSYYFYYQPDVVIPQMVKKFMHKNPDRKEQQVTDNNYMLVKYIINLFSIPRYHVYPKGIFDQVKFKSIKVRIPRFPIAYYWLELTYGRNWHIPNKNYTESDERKQNRRKRSL